jgi:hypothetical protein
MTNSATLSRPSATNRTKGKAKSSKPQLVQHTFQWDAPTASTISTNANTTLTTNATKSAGTSDCFLTAPKKSRPLMVAKSKSERVGHCEHAGGLMEKVLSRYGISPDEFRRAVEELRASRAMNSR